MSLRQSYRRFSNEPPQGPGERLLLALLRPFGQIYGLIMSLRARFYRSNILQSYRAPVPVISVGNLSVGGTGKTPVVDRIVCALLARGERPAIISRGYGGVVKKGVAIVSDGKGSAPLLEARICGDEPYLLARRNPEVIVVVAPQRKTGIEHAVDHCGATVIVLDDGFQHLAVQRDLDIVLLDARRPFGNGFVLPAGPLRERPDALQRGDLFMLTRTCEENQPEGLPLQPVVRCYHRLSSTFVRLEGTTVDATALAGKRLVAFAGIALPEAFFAQLRRLGLDLVTVVPLDDHTVFTPDTLKLLNDAGKNADFFVTTEKDGVKLRPHDLQRPCLQAVLELTFKPQDLFNALLERVLTRNNA